MNTVTRQNNFNLIRLVLALLVMLSHSPELVDGNRSRELLTRMFGTLSFGELAVDSFFLLSGYLILQSWHSDPQPWPFLKKRLLRIYPGFIAAALVCAFLVGPLAADPFQYFADLDMSKLVGSITLLQLPAIPPVFSGRSNAFVNGSMWTISHEFLCYLLVLAAGASGALRRRHVWAIFSAIAFITMATLKLRMHPVDANLRLGVCFLSGGCFFMYRDQIRMNGLVAVALLGAVVVGLHSWRGAELAVASAGAYVLVYAAGKRSPLLSHFNRLPDVSYGVYLYGWPIQKLLLWFDVSMSPWTLFLIATPIAIAAGAVSWHYIEKPALKFKGFPVQIQDTEVETVIQ